MWEGIWKAGTMIENSSVRQIYVSRYLFTPSPEIGKKSGFQMCYFLNTEHEIKFSSQVIISGNLNVYTEHAQIFLACQIICMYKGHSQRAGRCRASARPPSRGDWSKRKYIFLVTEWCDAWYTVMFALPQNIFSNGSEPKHHHLHLPTKSRVWSWYEL